MKRIRWGICGAGGIAGHFADTLNRTGGIFAAVASTDGARAEAFRTRFGAKKAYGSYEAMAEAGGVDAVYVATHHPAHAPAAEIYLSRGIPVLAEKPLSINLDGVKRMAACAEKNGALLMEAMWTKFLPATAAVLELAGSGEIGGLRYTDAVMGFRFPAETGRAFRNDLAGGGLLDLGVYTMSYTRWLLGEFVKTVSCCKIGETGVDDLESVTVQNAAGVLGHMLNGVDAEIGNHVLVCGTGGKICVPDFNGAQEFTVTKNGAEKTYRFPHRATGFEYEIEHFEGLVRDGKRESDVMPLSENLAVLTAMDSLRREWGLVFRPHEGG